MKMTCNGKALFLIWRSVKLGQLTSSGVKARGYVLSGSRGFIQPRILSRAVRDKGLFEPQSAVTTSLLHYCIKSQAPVQDGYPPLPEYQSNSESQKKEVYIIQVKGLPWSCSAQDLLQFFSECRIRDGVKGIHLTTDRLGRPSGRAFIEMEHEDDVGKALEKHRQYLGPRYVEVYEVTNNDAEAILKTAAEAVPSDWVVRLRGIPFSSSEADIVQFLSGLDIEQNGITIVTDHRGRNSGEAYVQFTSQEAFEVALRKDRELIGNRYIEVFPSKRDEIRTAWRSRTNSSLPQHSPSTPIRTASATENTHRTGSHLSSDLPLHYVHMRGLPFSVSGEDIAMFFSPLVVSKLLIEFGPDGRPSGEANVYFRDHQEAVAAMSRDRNHIGERYVELFLNSDPDSDRK